MSRSKIKLELTRLEAELLMRALKIAEKENSRNARYAADEMDQEEALNIAVVYYALRIIISRAVAKGE